jgi:hypothetical protein
MIFLLFNKNIVGKISLLLGTPLLVLGTSGAPRLPLRTGSNALAAPVGLGTPDLAALACLPLRGRRALVAPVGLGTPDLTALACLPLRGRRALAASVGLGTPDLTALACLLRTLLRTLPRTLLRTLLSCRGSVHSLKSGLRLSRIPSNTHLLEGFLQIIYCLGGF